MQTHTFTVTQADRLDKTLAALLGDVSRSAMQRLIEQQHVLVNGQPRPVSHRVKPGDVVVVSIPDPAPSETLPEQIVLDILYEDDDVVAVNKPAGMVVHPGAGNLTGTLANAILAHAPDIAEVGDAARPGIVHRLDKETSGIVLLAKTPAAYAALQRQFKSRSVRKLYLAICVGRVEPTRGIINKPIGRDPARRQRMAIVVDGRESVTPYEVVEVYAVREDMTGIASPVMSSESVEIKKGSTYSFVRARPATGRTHQLRVHFASIGYPIVGDALYGATRHDALSRALTPRHLLHASEVTFEQPTTGMPIHLVTPLPADMQAVLDALRRSM
jgi:23S rRNA pseudouridine1911/1915/1917 synthase